jgi:hypothetical protein
MSQSPRQISAALHQLRQDPPVLISRERESAALRAHLRARQSVFVSGPAGVGKSALLQATYADWDADREGFPVCYSADSGTRRGIATHTLVNLFLQQGRLESRYIERRTTVASLGDLRRFLVDGRLADLKRMMHQNLARGHVCLLLDHLDDPDPRVAALIEGWLETTSLVIAARDTEAVGRVRWLLSAFERLEVPPLPQRTLLRLARDGIGKLDAAMREADVHEAVRRSAGNPAQLQRLLHAAARPEHQKNGAVQWKLVMLDERIQASGLGERRAIRRSSW